MQLVVGSTGSIGSAIVDELAVRGQRVRALVRDPGKAQRVFTHSGNVEFVVGSAEESRTLEKAFEGVDVFFNCLNPPYHEWNRLPAIHENILDAAKKTSARMVFLETCTSTVTPDLER